MLSWALLVPTGVWHHVLFLQVPSALLRLDSIPDGGMASSCNSSPAFYKCSTKAPAERQHIFSIWSTIDAVIGSGCVVWGQNTCRVPGDDDDLHVLLDHLSIRSLTAEAQIQMVVDHTVPQ